MSTLSGSQHPLADVLTRMQSAARLFMMDLSAMDDAVLAEVPGGKARSGYDIAYEVALINNLVAARASGNTAAVDRAGWVRAPIELCAKDAAIAYFENSVQNAVAALQDVPTERLSEIVESPLGPIPLGALANILPSHIMYHSGQLNYIQTIYGDDAFHW